MRLPKRRRPPLSRRTLTTADLETFFDRVIVIEHDSDSVCAFRRHIGKFDWPFARPSYVRAVAPETVELPGEWPGSAASWARLRTHQRVVEDASAFGASSLLVIEDDARFPANLNTAASDELSTAPDGWRLLWCGRSYAVHRRGYASWYGALVHALASGAEDGDVVRGSYERLLAEDITGGVTELSLLQNASRKTPAAGRAT